MDKRHSVNDSIFSRTEIVRSKKKVKLDLPIYARKADLKNSTGVDTLKGGFR